MKKVVLFVLVFFWAIPSGFAQLKTYTFEEAEKQAKENPKPFFIFTHTSWCKYCKMMEQSTFKNQEIITLLNDNFYFIPFDAQSKTAVFFHGKTFHSQPAEYHELAHELGRIDKQLSFPVSCILNRDYEMIFQVNRFLSVKELKIILNKALEN